MDGGPRTSGHEHPIRPEVPHGPVLSKHDRARIRDAIAELDTVTADTVLRAARNRANPLHEYFEWDNSKAAHEYRLAQARFLIRSVYVQVEAKKDDRRRAYVNVTVEDGTRVYVDRERAIGDDELRAQMVEAALGELRGWCRRYGDVDELQSRVSAVRALV